jgi:signal transduction histidine kinase
LRYMQAIGCKAQLLVPLVSRDRPLGLLELQTVSSERLFSSEEINLCQTIANHMATALENAQLFTTERQRSAELEALRQASLSLTSTLELKPVLEAILEQATKLVSADDAHIFLYDGNQLIFGAAIYYGAFQSKPLSEPRPDGMTYMVARWAKRIVVPDMTQHPLFKDEHPSDHQWGGAIVGLPLSIGSKVLGIMNLAYFNPHVFEESELHSLELLADQAAVALNNAHLYAEIQQRAQALTDALRRLQEIDRLKREFIQNVSHELRTPVTILLGYAELLESGELGILAQEQREPISIILRRARLLSSILDNLLTILETEASDQVRKEVDISDLLITLVDELKRSANQAEIQLNIEISPNLPCVLGVKNHLRKAFENLVSNALKFTPAGGQVNLRAWQEDEDIIIELSDTGIGIPIDQLESIFDRFYQVDGSTKRRYGGTGMGLALVKEVVDSHEGNIKVDSKVGEGSKFLVRLPATRREFNDKNNEWQIENSGQES